MLCVKQEGIKYHFWAFGMARPGTEPRSPESLANTLRTRPMNTKKEPNTPYLVFTKTEMQENFDKRRLAQMMFY